MAEVEGNGYTHGSLDFIEGSILSTIIPLDTHLDIENILGTSTEYDGGESPLAAIPQRHNLFFDETVIIHVVLRTPYLNEGALKSYLGRLVIDLEAQVVSAQPDSQEGPVGREIIYHASVQDNQDPLIVVQGPETTCDGQEARHILVVWNVFAFLARPRLRLQNPLVIFSASANLKPMEQLKHEILRDEYLASQEPSAMNLLEAFKDDPALDGSTPWLSALRVSRVPPLSQASRGFTRAVQNVTRQSLKVYPAINARVRYSRPTTTSTNPSVIASLDIDITPFAPAKIHLTTATLSLLGGTVEELNQASGFSLPALCSPQDDLTFLYRLLPDEWSCASKSPLRTLEISITATALLTPNCTPTISMKWSTTLDFTPPLNPVYGQPTQPIQRPHRPAQLSIGSSAFENSPTASTLALTHPDTLPPTNEPVTRTQRDPSIPDFGVTMTVTGPPPSQPMHPGTPFVWSVFVVNRSDRPRKLAILILPKRRHAESRTTRPPSTGYGSRGKNPKTADAFIDENIVHAMQKNSAVEAAEVVCLSTDTRIGLLAPQACYEVELKFVALTTGVLEVEGVRVLDLGTQEHVDIRDLPTIVVSPMGVVAA